MFKVVGFDLNKNQVWSEEKKYKLDETEIMTATGIFEGDSDALDPVDPSEEREIYEGDLINVWYSSEIGEPLFQGPIEVKNPFDYDLYEANWLIHANKIEIVGNIFQGEF